MKVKSKKSNELQTGNASTVQLPGQVGHQPPLSRQAFEVLDCQDLLQNLVVGLRTKGTKHQQKGFWHSIGTTESVSVSFWA